MMRWMLLCVAFVAMVHAEPVVTLPLDGYYRPGKFFPVRIESDRDVSVEIKADAVSSRGRGRSLVLPVMSLSPVPGVVRVTIDGKTTELPIHPLEADQPLWLQLGDTELERPTPGKFVVVNAAGGVRGLNMAYESADYIQIAPDQLQYLSTAPLMLAGTTFVAGQEMIGVQPGAQAPEIRGPTTSLDDQRPYNIPVVASRDLGTRRQTWLLLALFSIVVLALALSRWRFCWAAIGACSLAALAFGAYRWSSISPVTTATVDVRYAGRSLVYQDRWTFMSSLDDTPQSFYAVNSDMVRPIFAGQAQKLSMVIEPAVGGWQYHFHLPRQGRVVMVGRGLIQPQVIPNADTAGGTFRDVARGYYLRANETIVRQPSGIDDRYEAYWVMGK